MFGFCWFLAGLPPGGHGHLLSPPAAFAIGGVVLLSRRRSGYLTACEGSGDNGLARLRAVGNFAPRRQPPAGRAGRAPAGGSRRLPFQLLTSPPSSHACVPDATSGPAPLHRF